MGVFDSILFEGQQADEYRARKEREAADKKDAEKNRNSRRYESNDYRFLPPGDKDRRNGFFFRILKDIKERERDQIIFFCQMMM